MRDRIDRHERHWQKRRQQPEQREAPGVPHADNYR
jgi:hypothetical protein